MKQEEERWVKVPGINGGKVMREHRDYKVKMIALASGYRDQGAKIDREKETKE